MKQTPVLIVALDDVWRRELTSQIATHGLACLLADNGLHGRALLQQHLPGVIVCSLIEPLDIDLSWLAASHALHPLARKIVITPRRSLVHLLEVVEAGACEVFRNTEPCELIAQAVIDAHACWQRWLTIGHCSPKSASQHSFLPA